MHEPPGNKKDQTIREFKPNIHYFVNAVFALIMSLVTVMAASNRPNVLNIYIYLVAFLVGVFIYVGLIAIESSQKLLLDNGILRYRGKNVDLSRLTDLSAKKAVLIMSSHLGAAYSLSVTDRAGNVIKLPLGNWQGQDDLLAALGGYAAIAGGVVNKQAEKLINKAKNNYKVTI